MIIFCDGVFDLFHSGHINHFKKIKNIYPGSLLIVGILNDKEATSYKRKPIFNQEKRKSLVDSCKYVDKTTFDYPIIMTEDFLNKNNIDLVVHAFSNKLDIEKQKIYFEIPIKLNKMKIIDYNNGISTTELLNNINKKYIGKKNGWDKIWELKGKENSNDLRNLNGYENTYFNYDVCFQNIIDTLKIKKKERILEIGCGAGILSELFNDYDYFGIDYSKSLILKNILINNSKVIKCQANLLPFKDKYFDYSFSVGVFEYFPSKEYANECIKEMLRVSKKGLYIINIINKTHKNKLNKHKYDGGFKHLIYNYNDFNILDEYKLVDGTYENDNRFSILKIIKS